MKKVGFVIGRFQVPKGPHSGHMSLFRSILEENDVLVVLIGSANKYGSIKNPYTFQLRRSQVLAALQKTQYKNSGKEVYIFPLNDYPYNDSQWLADVHCIMERVVKLVPDVAHLRLYGHYKEGNDYLTWFPNVEYVNIVADDVEISGTAIRKALKNLLPTEVVADMEYYEKERALFSSYPFPETLNFNCADSVVECLGHVLLIERKFTPGKGTWALPGGFKNRNETFKQCALRELLEETNLRVPLSVLQGSIVQERLFDSPFRSNGIPRNSYVVHIKLKPNNDGSLPRANGGDDASTTKWVPISEAINSMALYDDHSDILSEMSGIRPVPASGHINFIL